MEDNYVCLGPMGAITILIGLYLGWRALKDWMKYRLSGNWIPITGLVTSSEVDISVGDEYSTSSYTPIIKYTYQLIGKSYESSQISFGSEGKDMKRKKAEALVARYPVDCKPTIYYNPEDPSQSVLERKYNPSGALTSLGFLIFGGITFYGYLAGY
jgi:hypothetical protein